MPSNPADPGAPSGLGSIPLCVPQMAGNELVYLKQCIDDNWVSSGGAFVGRFEDIMAGYVGSNHGVAVQNGTAALHIALLVAGVEADDEVLVSDLTFVAPANAVRYIGAWPVFMDAEPDYWQMDPAKVVDFLDNACHWQDGKLVNKVTNRRVRAILPVHILGHPCDMDPILEAAQRYELAVVEDATESLGASYKGAMAGNLGDLGCLSFNGNKLITTGGGGMIVTKNGKWAERAQYLTTQAKDDPVEYYHREIGYNYRLTNIQAALGVAQMENIDDFVAKKRQIARTYEAGFSDVEGITVMSVQTGADPTYWLYTVLLPEGTDLEGRKSVVTYLNDNGVGARPLWHPIHGLPPYLECQSHRIEHSLDLYRRAVSLPSSVGLTAEDQQTAIETLKNCPAT